MARPGTWPKGTSGNPGGKPKGLAEVVALARAETAANIAALVRIRDDRNSPPAAVVAASTAMLNRAWGLPMQVIAGDEERGPILFRFEWADASASPSADAPSIIDAADTDVETPLVLEWQSSC